MISGIVLAAGRATRMGRTKQLLPVAGRPMLQHAIDTSHDAGLDEVIVVLGHDAELVVEAIRLPANGMIVVNPDYAKGQASSLRAGLAAADERSEAAVVLLGDQPGVTADAVKAVVAGFAERGARIVRARYEDGPGHPVLLARSVWPAALEAEGDVGARDLIAAHPGWIEEVAVRGPRPADVDTENDYARLPGKPATS